MNNSDLQFLADDADENDGLGDAGIETYKDAVFASIARETGQNSADAWLSKPVKMKFDVIEIHPDELPGYQKLSSTVMLCLKQAESEKDEKAVDFFRRAKDVLVSSKIKVLHVADYNTKGLVGPSERGTPFHSLVKGSGISIKDSETSGGSFGIGKNAAFSISELQTVFYSSQYKSEDGKLNFISQGKTILVSHIDEEGKRKKAKGYWGLPGFKAVTDITEVPQWAQREELGTSIFCAGFRYQEGWQFKMAASLLTNFFCAIHKEEMEFGLNTDEIQLNKHTLPELFQNDDIRKAAEENNSLEAFEFSKALFNCLTSAHTKVKEFPHDTLGKISFKILVGENLPKKLALIRNGMIITDSLEHFGDKFAKFPMSKEFVAIVEVQEKSGNTLIKKLENPRHDGLSAERINDPKKRKDAITAIKALIRLIRDAIREETISMADKEVAVDELTEFFADETSREKSNDPDHEDNLETFVYKLNERQQSRHAITTSTDGKKATGNRKRFGKKSGNLSGRRKKKKNRPLTDGEGNSAGYMSDTIDLNMHGVRNIFVNVDGKLFRRIYFTSPFSCEAQISIQATGINDAEDLTLASIRGAAIKSNKVVIEVKEGERTQFDVEFLESYAGPIEIIAYTNGVKNEA